MRTTTSARFFERYRADLISDLHSRDLLEQFKNFTEPVDVTMRTSAAGRMAGRQRGDLNPEGQDVIHTVEQDVGLIEDVLSVPSHTIGYRPTE